ncbi:MAG: RcnB family protein, partial [Caulobacterales bacterium]
DNRGSWNRNDGGRRDWTRGNDRRWVDNRRDDRRWDRHDYRRDRHWDRGHNYYSDNRGWSRGRHNGYYYRNTWYYGPPPSRYYGDAYYNPGYRHWSRGYRCPDYYRDNVVYYGDYGLRRPPRGYRWVRADDDFLMIAAATGIIAAVILSD